MPGTAASHEAIFHHTSDRHTRESGVSSTPRPLGQNAGLWNTGSPAFAGDDHRSAHLTIFWHCSPPHFSSRTATGAASRQRTVNGFGRGFALQPGSGNADSQRKVWSSGCRGRCRPYLCDPGCVTAHPPYWRAAASYRPLRAVWAVCAWALRGSREITRPFSA